jgi:hypothetical protein
MSDKDKARAKEIRAKVRRAEAMKKVHAKDVKTAKKAARRAADRRWRGVDQHDLNTLE